MNDIGMTMYFMGAASGGLIIASVWMLVETRRVQRSIKKDIKLSDEKMG
jgi:hypothetical protein